VRHKEGVVSFIYAGMSLQRFSMSFVFLSFYIFIIYSNGQIYTRNNLADLFAHSTRMFHRHSKLFQQLFQKYMSTGSVADIARRPKRRVTTERQDIQIRLSKI